MTKKMRIIVGVGGIGLWLCLVVAWFSALYVIFFTPSLSVAPSYQPDCQANDAVCAAWTEFRVARGYPLQTFAGKRLADGSFVLVISEPAPVLSKAELDSLVKTTFGADLRSSPRRLRWYIGADGWLEDLVLHVSTSVPKNGEPFDDSVLRDRVALLHDALFGTTFGGDLQIIGAGKDAIEASAPNIQVSPYELSAWLDSALPWRPVAGAIDVAGTSWTDLAGAKAMGAYASGDGMLVMLTFPTSMLADARVNAKMLEPLRVPFREFAVASDAIFGGTWTAEGQTAILARARRAPFTGIPPLRYETFALLAAQSSDELAQSYERSTVFAGKLGSGEYERKDWAPIYLSAPLIDTEFGALLNITDQMLKSWSEGGGIEYVYFNYPKPAKFPFGDAVLSEELSKKYGSKETLFNWNTSGSAVIVKADGVNTLTAKQTGALPVTYGADGKPKDQGGEDLFEYEEKAYRYFGELQDPNLSRVVQYTLLFQLFRAMDESAAPPAPEAIQARAASTELLVDETAKFLDAFDAGNVTKPDELVESVRADLAALREAFPSYDNRRLASFLIDRASPERANIVREVERAEAELTAEQRRLKEEFAVLEASSGDETTINQASLVLRGTTWKSKYEVLGKSMKAIGTLGQSVWHLAAINRDLEPVRRRFIDANKAEPAGSIKTPSIVVSWSLHDNGASVGGHSVDARALKLEFSRTAKGIEVVTDAQGQRILRYGPEFAKRVESNASGLARAIEHRGVLNADALLEIAKAPARIRPRPEALRVALGKADVPAPQTFGTLGQRPVQVAAKDVVADLGTVAQKNDCCIFITRGKNNISIAAEKYPSPPPAVLFREFRDTPSVADYLVLISRRTGTAREKAVIFLDHPEAHVKALASNVEAGGSSQQRLAAMAKSLGEPVPKSIESRVSSAIVQRDLRGQPSMLHTQTGKLQARTRALFDRIRRVEPKGTWSSARIRQVSPERMAQLLKGTRWNNAIDGVPTPLEVQFTRGTTPGVTVVPGFPEAKAAAGYARLRQAHKNAIQLVSEAPANEGTIAQYLMTVRNELKNAPDIELKRLMVVVEDGEAYITIAQLLLDPEEIEGA